MGHPSFLTAWLRETALLRRYPYAAALLAQLTVSASNEVEVMAIALQREVAATTRRRERARLLVNIDYFAEHPQFRAGILLHELHHLALGHLTDPALVDGEHPDLLTIAKEISANEFIVEPLPEPHYCWQQYTAWGLAPGQSTLRRYELLVAARQQQLLPERLPGSNIDDHEQGPEPSTPEHPYLRRRSRSRQPSLQELRRLIAAHPESDAARLFAALMPPPDTVAGPGPDPSPNNSRRVEPLRHRATIDWAGVAHRVFSAARVRVPDWHRPSRRFPQAIGIAPGHSRRPARLSLLVALDTSGSMTPDLLSQIAVELRALARLAALTIVECDACIQRVYPFPGSLSDVRGGGATDFRPVFDEALLRAHARDGLVYCTDGQGVYPTHAPRVPVLWVLTATGPLMPPWGSVAHLGLPRGYVEPPDP